MAADGNADIGTPSQGLGRGWLIVAIAGTGAAIGPLDTAVNIAFPDITGSFGRPLSAIQWVIIAYVLTYASLLLNFGRFADIAGHRRVFLGGLGLSVAGLSACGLAPTYEVLLLARMAQGVGTALVLATGPALVTLAFPDELRPRAIGGYAMFLTGAAAVGPLAGGVLVGEWGWPAVFWFRVPIAIVVAIATLVFVRAPKASAAGQRFDFLGALLLTGALVSTLLAFNRASALGWEEPLTLGLAAASVLSIAGFVWVERSVESPVIEVRLFARRQFSIANVANVFAQMAGFSVFLLAPYFLVRFTGNDVPLAGLLLAVSPAGGAAAALVTGRLLARYSAWALSCAGLALVTTGLVGVSNWTPDAPTAFVAATLVVNGIGLGLFQVANMDYVIGSVARSQHGVAGALTTLTRTIGVVCGATAGSVLFASMGGVFPVGDDLGGDFMAPFGTIFSLAAVVSAFALFVMLAGGREARR